MTITSKAIAIVPARAGSKGLPNKNVKELAGKPLFRYSVDAAIEAGFAEVYISTDIEEIIMADLPNNVVVVRRPARLSGDDVLMAEVLLNVISTHGLEHTTVTLLQPTSPLRKAETIKHAKKIFEENDYSLVMSVCEAPSVVLKWGILDGDQFRNISDPKYCFMNRQSLPVVFRPNGAIYTFSAQQFLHDKGFSSRSIGVVRMPPEESYDIDTLEDFHKCEMIIRKGEEI